MVVTQDCLFPSNTHINFISLELKIKSLWSMFQARPSGYPVSDSSSPREDSTWDQLLKYQLANLSVKVREGQQTTIISVWDKLMPTWSSNELKLHVYRYQRTWNTILILISKAGWLNSLPWVIHTLPKR